MLPVRQAWECDRLSDKGEGQKSDKDWFQKQTAEGPQAVPFPVSVCVRSTSVRGHLAPSWRQW